MIAISTIKQKKKLITESKRRPLLSMKHKPKIYVNPKHADKPDLTPKTKSPKQVKEPKPKQPPPKTLSREERMARNRAKITPGPGGHFQSGGTLPETL